MVCSTMCGSGLSLKKEKAALHIKMGKESDSDYQLVRRQPAKGRAGKVAEL